MTYYDHIFEIAAENFGLITTAQARKMGIAKEELGKLRARGKLHHVGRGVYRVKHYAPSSLDIYADAAALVGPEAYVLGESVLAMQNLASVNPEAITVGTPKRVRKQLPCYVKVVQRPLGDAVTLYDGIPCMTVADSIRYCEGKIMPDRLEEALVDALAEGLVTKRDVEAIRKELTWQNPSNPIK